MYRPGDDSHSDGIGEAEEVVIANGGVIKDGWISLPVPAPADGNENFWDAVQFLIEEWDYAIQPT